MVNLLSIGRATNDLVVMDFWGFSVGFKLLQFVLTQLVHFVLQLGDDLAPPLVRDGPGRRKRWGAARNSLEDGSKHSAVAKVIDFMGFNGTLQLRSRAGPEVVALKETEFLLRIRSRIPGT
jgi:hypothetical protein